MGQFNARQAALAAVTAWKSDGRHTDIDAEVGGDFGVNVFSDEAMRERLPDKMYKALRETIRKGAPLDAGVADAVAGAMKDWAIAKGATHYTHWFQPMTGLTAEKHDSFLTPTEDGKAVAEFSGKELVRGEPDASSVPLRRPARHLRGSWIYGLGSRPRPPFIMENPNGATLVHSHGVHARGPAKRWTRRRRSCARMEALSRQADACRQGVRFDLEGQEGRSQPSGAEQEYFLIDKNFYFARPDLLNARAARFSARRPPKGQEMEDQYFGAIPDRVLAYMARVCEAQLFQLGVPVKTRHNEVAPSASMN